MSEEEKIILPTALQERMIKFFWNALVAGDVKEEEENRLPEQEGR